MTEKNDHSGRWPYGPPSWKQTGDQQPDIDEEESVDQPDWEEGPPGPGEDREEGRSLPVVRGDTLPAARPNPPAVMPANPHLANYARGLARLPATRIHTVAHYEDTQGGTETARAAADTLKAVEHSLKSGGGVIAGIRCNEGELMCYVAGDLAGRPAPRNSDDEKPQVTPDWPPTAIGERIDPVDIVAAGQDLPYWTAVAVELDAVGQTTGREMGRSIAEVLGTDAGDWEVRVTAVAEDIPNAVAYERLQNELAAFITASTGIDMKKIKTREEMETVNAHAEASIAEISRLKTEMDNLKREGLGRSRTQVKAVLHAGAPDPLTLEMVVSAWNRSAPPNVTLARSPHPPTADGQVIGSNIPTETLLQIVRLPEKPLPGLSHIKVPHTSPVVAPPPPGMPEGHLGDIIVGANGRGRRFGLTERDYAGGVYIVAERGWGKSTALRDMCVDAAEQGKRLVVCDPPGQLRETMKKLPPDRKAVELRPGDPDQPQPSFNPFKAVEGGDVRRTMEGAYSLMLGMLHDPNRRDSSFPGNIRSTINRIYEQAGWDPKTGLPIPDKQQRWPNLHDFHEELLRVIGRVDADTAGSGSNSDAVNYAGWADARIKEILDSPLGQLLIEEEGQELSESELDDKHVFITGSGVPAWVLRIYHQVVANKLSERNRVLRIQAGQLDGISNTITDVHVIDEVNLTLSNDPSGPEAGATAEWFKWLEVCRNLGNGVIIGAISFEDAPPQLTRMLSTIIVGRVKGSTRVTAAGLTDASPGLHAHMPYQANGRAVVFNYRTQDGPIRIKIVGEKPDNPDTVVTTTADIAKSGSPACGPSCGTNCCTSGEMNQATVFSGRGERGKELTALAQFATICTLTAISSQSSEPLPVTPSAEFVRYVKGMPEKAAECAIRAAVNTAVDERKGLLSKHNVSVADLKRYVAAQLRAMILGQQAVTAAGIELVLAPYRPAPVASPEDAETPPDQAPSREKSPLPLPDQRALFLGDRKPPLIARDLVSSLPRVWGGGWDLTERMDALATEYLAHGASKEVSTQYESYVAAQKEASSKR